jgi:N-glycosylase/DNA lyase
VTRNHQPVNIESICATHKARRKEIRARLAEFQDVGLAASDERLWEELVFCIFTAGASAMMGLKSIQAVRPLLKKGKRAQMTRALQREGAHRFPVARPGYIVSTRKFLRAHCDMRLHQLLQDFSDPLERRDWLAQESRIKGLGYKESSHFLRNVGFKGYGILDKHVVRCLADLGIADSQKPPATRARYLDLEEKLRRFARDIRIDFDELDLVLWSMKTGQVLK